MLNKISQLIFFLTDAAVITLSLWFVEHFNNDFGSSTSLWKLIIEYWPLYIIILGIFLFEGIYRNRYDFWHESRIVLRSLLLSFFIFVALFSLKETEHRPVIFLVELFLVMALLIPFFKRALKITLHRIGLWQKPVKIPEHNLLLAKEIFGNPYLGYRPCHFGEDASTYILDARQIDPLSLKSMLQNAMRAHREVLFIPNLNEYDLTLCEHYELTNVQSNLIRIENRLLSRFRRFIKFTIDFFMALSLLPLLSPVILLVALWIKREDPKGKIFFLQPRLGRNAKPFICFKFRTMHENADELLQAYLQEHPEENEFFRKYHKYRNDPRITQAGKFLRASSLDELPQIFNVLRGEMSLVGPRPYMLSEREEMGKHIEMILRVRPGITGLWQVSGRNRLDFRQRIEMDVWYIRNWSLWLDLVILLKTFKSVWKREGAY